MRETIATERLTLRTPAPRDAAAVTEAMSRFDVARMLARPAWPYALAHAEAWILRARDADWSAVIEIDGACAGHVSITDHLGYWLAPARHGRGFMTEAAGALVDAWFRRETEDRLASGCFHDNPASRRVLAKIGFAETGRSFVWSNARRARVEHLDMALTRAAWRARRVEPAAVEA